MGRLFGTDGARGVAVTELTCETAMQIGRAAASVLCKRQATGQGYLSERTHAFPPTLWKLRLRQVSSQWERTL